MKSTTSEILAGIHDLRTRAASRPEGMTWKSITATCGGLLAIGMVMAVIIE